MQLLSSLRNRIPSLAVILSLLTAALLTSYSSPSLYKNNGALSISALLH